MTTAQVLDHLDVRYNVTVGVRSPNFRAALALSILAGLYDGMPSRETLIGLIASRGIDPGDIVSHDFIPAIAPLVEPATEAKLALANVIGAIFADPARHDEIHLTATVAEVLLDDQPIAQPIFPG